MAGLSVELHQSACQLTEILLPSPQGAPWAPPLTETNTFLLLLSKEQKQQAWGGLGN